MPDIIYSEQVKDTLERMRRSISDIEEEQDFSDDTLYYYLCDAVDELEIGDYKKGLHVDKGDFYDSKNRVVSIPSTDKMLYALKAHILFKTSIKDKADRDNFALHKNKLTVDTSGQSNNHKQTLEMLETRLSKLLYQLNNRLIHGIRVE